MNETGVSMFNILEDWEGEVISMNDCETFSARMTPTRQETSSAEAIISFPLDELPSDMRDRVRLGGTLRWINGKYNGKSIDVFDVDIAPGEVPVTQRTSPSLGELANRSQVVQQAKAGLS